MWHRYRSHIADRYTVSSIYILYGNDEYDILYGDISVNSMVPTLAMYHKFKKRHSHDIRKKDETNVWCHPSKLEQCKKKEQKKKMDEHQPRGKRERYCNYHKRWYMLKHWFMSHACGYKTISTFVLPITFYGHPTTKCIHSVWWFQMKVFSWCNTICRKTCTASHERVKKKNEKKKIGTKPKH